MDSHHVNENVCGNNALDIDVICAFDDNSELMVRMKATLRLLLKVK